MLLQNILQLVFIFEAVKLASTGDSKEKHDNDKCLVGSIVLYPGDKIPNCWKACNGQSLERSKYKDLFDILGESHGCIDKKTFNLPDFREKYACGLKTGASCGIQSICGKSTVQLKVENLPPHSHKVDLQTTVNGTHTHDIDDNGHDHGGWTGPEEPAKTKNFRFVETSCANEECVYVPDGNHKHTIPNGKTYINIKPAGDHKHNVYGDTCETGSGVPFEINPLCLPMNFIICTGVCDKKPGK